MKDRHKGILVALLGVLVISPDAVLVRFLSLRTDVWVIIFWKLLLSIAVSAPYAVYETGGLRPLLQSIVKGKYYYMCAIPVQAVVDMGFTFSLTWTTAANALLLLNLNPLWCALLGRAFLGDQLPRRTIVALFLAICCMMVIFVPDIIHRQNGNNDDSGQAQVGEEDEAIQSSSTKGNVTACLTGMVLAVYISIVRKAGMKTTTNNNNNSTDDDNTGVNLVGATSLAALLVSIIVLIVRRGNVLPDSSWRRGSGGEEEGDDGELWQFWLAIGADGMALGILFVCLTIAPRLAKGAEVALVLLLEIILGPLWVFLAYRDVPSVWTLIGGSILLVVLALHESAPLFQKAHREFSKHMSGRFATKSRTVEDTEVADEVVVVEDSGDGCNHAEKEDDDGSIR